MGYIINEWAIVRRGELVVAPNKIVIHQDFLNALSAEAFEKAFRQVGELFYQMITDISVSPEHFGMPLHDTDTTPYGAAEALESRHATWRLMKLLYAIFNSGSLVGDDFIIDLAAFKQKKKIKNTHLLLGALRDYGFDFEGLTNGKITAKTTEFIMNYPDNADVLIVLAVMAEKAESVSNEDLFCKWSFRLLEEPIGVFNYTDPFYTVYDKSRKPDEKIFIEAFHKVMREIGYFWQYSGWNEGPGINYYDKEAVMKRKGPYQFRILDWKGDLQLMLRVRNPEKCLEIYADKPMPPEILEMFRHTDAGCGTHQNGTCQKGVGYIFEGEERWHCGCCNAPFLLHPKAENIEEYLEMVKVGEKRGV